MPKASWNDVVIAEASENDVVIVEGNVYFPPSAVHREYLRPSSEHTTCPWKGLASYYDIEIGGQINRGAAWYYPDPKPAAARIRDRIAFWKGVRVDP